MDPVVEEEPVDNRNSFSGINEAAVSLKLVAPQGIGDGKKVADYLKAGCSVVLNIENMPNENEVIRFMDFLHGVIYMIQGNIKPVSKTTYVATPSNVEVDGEENNEN